jgi:hypothetical protein
VREINVSRTGDPVHTVDKALTWETPAQRGRDKRYAIIKKKKKKNLFLVTIAAIFHK